MTEGEFVRFYKKRNKSKSHKEVKKKIDLFWDVLLKALDEEKKVVFKYWGVFEEKEVKSRKVLVPIWKEARYTEPKKIVKFRPGKRLVEIANGDADEQKRAGKAIPKNEFRKNNNNKSKRRDRRVS